MRNTKTLMIISYEIYEIAARAVASVSYDMYLVELGFAIRRLENSFCQLSSKLAHFPNQGRIRQRKKRDGLRLSLAVPKIHWVSNPLRLFAMRIIYILCILGDLCAVAFMYSPSV